MEKYRLECEKREGTPIPEIFPPNYGVGEIVTWEGKEYIAFPCNRQGVRKVNIDIMTHRGIASDATHYYVNIDYLPLFFKEKESMRHFLPFGDDGVPELMWGWRMKIHRKITPEELKTKRFEFFNHVEDEFRYTDALNSWEEIIEALEIFLPKFKGCLLGVDSFSKALEKIIIKKFEKINNG